MRLSLILLAMDLILLQMVFRVGSTLLAMHLVVLLNILAMSVTMEELVSGATYI